MRNIATGLALPGSFVLVLALAACVEPPSSFQPDDVAVDPQANVVGAECDLVKGLTTDVRSYFPQPEQRDAQEKMRDLEKACGTGVQETVTGLAGQLLSMAEVVLDDGRGGDPTVGSRMVNGLLACTVSLCNSSALPGVDFAASLSDPAGLFAVRFDDTHPAVARGAVPFTDFDGNPNSALWGVEVDPFSWSVVTDANPVLIYGAPAAGGPALQDVSFGAVSFELNRWPDRGPFEDDALHVGVCYSEEVLLPHENDNPSLPTLLERMQREGTLLSAYVPTFCPPSVQSASVMGPVLALVRTLLPRPLLALMMTDKRVPHTGGSALDFSTFTPVAANTNGHLELVSGPNSVVTVGESIGVIRVRARSGAGTPIEKVKVTLAVENNSGTPAGAVLSGDVEAFTSEEDGIATFENASVGKPGGYIICATAELGGFAFERVCTGLFQAQY
jgi:hypothetical protein